MPPVNSNIQHPWHLEERQAIEELDADDFERINRRVKLYDVLLHRALLALPVTHRQLRAEILEAFKPQ